MGTIHESAEVGIVNPHSNQVDHALGIGTPLPNEDIKPSCRVYRNKVATRIGKRLSTMQVKMLAAVKLWILGLLNMSLMMNKL